MKSIDYGWVILVIAVVLVAVFWKPLVGGFTGAKDKMNNKEKYDRGLAVFNDASRWTDKDANAYKSCACCHSADFKAAEGKQVKMGEYKEGQPVILKDIRHKYSAGGMGTDEEILEQINKCVTSPTRLASASYSRAIPWMDDLIFYVSRQ